MFYVRSLLPQFYSHHHYLVKVFTISSFIPRSWFTTIYNLSPEYASSGARTVTLQKHMSSLGGFRGVCVCQSFVVCVLGTIVCNVVLFPFPTGYCTVCPSINVFWLHLLVSFLIMSAFVLPLYLPYRNVSSGWFILCSSQI